MASVPCNDHDSSCLGRLDDVGDNISLPNKVVMQPSGQRDSYTPGRLCRILRWQRGCVQGETWLARHAHVLQAVEKARSGGDVAKALLFVERMLVEQGMMQPQWELHFQPGWRHSLAKCSDSRQAMLYLAALQVQILSLAQSWAFKSAGDPTCIQT